MVTRNFLNVLAMALQSGSNRGDLIVKGCYGYTRYLTGDNHPFLSSPTKTVTTDYGVEGISVGTGNTAPTEDDWKLENTLSSGISLAVASPVYGIDTPCTPYAQYDVTVTNTGSDPITVKEIGYKQKLKVTKYPNGSGSSDMVCLIDRTVLDTPVTVAAGDAGIIHYKLRTIAQAYNTVEGVELVNFTFGTDEQIAAILDLASAGTIDLQRDAHWRVGEIRKIHVESFTGGGGVVCPAQDIGIVITSFEEYNSGLGNVLQFDFVDAFNTFFRMNSSNTTAGGYGASEMYTTTLPALVEALPSWLKTRLKTFSVECNQGGNNTTQPETVGNNKLALRSQTEVFGQSTWSGNVDQGEWVEYYRLSSNRYKGQGYGGGSANYRLRSISTALNFCYVYGNNATVAADGASNTKGLAPFGCI